MYKVLHCRVCITGMASSLSSLSLHENKHWGQILYKVVFAFLQICIPCGPSMMDYPETSGNLRKQAAEVSGKFPNFLLVCIYFF